MDPGHRANERVSDGTEPHAQRAQRVSGLAVALRPAFTSSAIESRSTFAESYRVADEVEIGPFGLDVAAVILLHKGTLEAAIPFAGVQQMLAMGGVIVLPPATAMKLRLREADFTIIYLTMERTAGLAPGLTQRRELVPTFDPKDVQLPMLLSIVRDEMQAGFPTGPDYFEGLALAIALRIFGLYSAAIPAGGTSRGGLSPTQVRKAKNRILMDLDKSVPLKALAAEAGLSRSHFCRAFKQSTGASPHQWRLKKRFERALGLMADDSVTLSSIAMTLGFASLSHFSIAFKRATGLSPSHYRRKDEP
jgi:AraC-like DNA-binding protein